MFSDCALKTQCRYQKFHLPWGPGKISKYIPKTSKTIVSWGYKMIWELQKNLRFWTSNTFLTKLETSMKSLLFCILCSHWCPCRKEVWRKAKI
jgi:hypothetical protein